MPEHKPKTGADRKTAPEPDTKESDRRYAEKMRKKKAVRDRMLKGKTIEKGLVIVMTGKGKGKTTAATGLALRALGRGMKIGIVQFVKGAWETGERKALQERFSDLCTIKAMGEGFSWETQDRVRDKQLAERAWAEAETLIADPSLQMVILDEINIVLRHHWLEIGAVLARLKEKPPMLHVVLTGRNADAALIEAADLVTEMTEIKHPFRKGVKAQLGIEF